MNELLNKINDLKRELDSLRPMKEEDESRLWEKLRLEWNYNSNHIEGNTMTYGDTELLLRLGDEYRAQNNTLKEVNEMRAHDAAIFALRDWTKKSDRKLTEKDIRDLNKLILVKDFYADAQTPSGAPTRRKIKVGQYKEFPNHVRLKSGEVFKYAEPNEVPAKMHGLVDWYNENQNEHPLILAAFLHYKFVIIHPFDDGNGRVSRLLMNYHLMKNNYPPLIIKSVDKANYLFALNQADTGNKDAFVKYLGDQMIWSLELTIKAATGESIKEKGDLDKEIEVWKKAVKSGLPTTLKRSNKVVMMVFDEGIDKLFTSTLKKSEVFKEMFNTHSHELDYKSELKNGVNSFKGLVQPHFRKSDGDDLVRIDFAIGLKNPITNPDETGGNAYFNMTADFKAFKYTLTFDTGEEVISDSYNTYITQKQIDDISEQAIKILFERVKELTS